MSEIVRYIEIDIDYCSLDYGNAPCTASLSGDNKCFNTLKTCQDLTNYDNSPITLRFSEQSSTFDKSIEAIPCVENINYSPSKISLGSSLGQRASLSVTLFDHKHSDTGIGFDKYLSDRTYDPYNKGTFWGKFRARNPYLRGRKLRLITGKVGQDISEMESRLFFIDGFDGNNQNGKFTIVAKDLLKFADSDRAQAPFPSLGKLSGDISSSATTANLSPSGIGNDEYPASGWLNLGGDEIVSFTRVGDVLTIARAQFNTQAVAHEVGARVQLCIDFVAQNPASVIYDLFDNYTNIENSYLNLVDWQEETDFYYRRVVSTLITEPTSVRKLVGELIEQCGLMIWWDNLGSQIRLRVLRNIDSNTKSFDEYNILENSFTSKEQPNSRLSQVWTYFGLRNPLKSVTEPDNFRSVAILRDLDAEKNHGQPAIKKIFSRWIPFGGLVIADRVNEIILGRFVEPPRLIGFDIERFGNEFINLGDGANITNWNMQNALGEKEIVPIQVTRLSYLPHKLSAVAEEMRFKSFSNLDNNQRTITVDGAFNNFNLKTQHDLLFSPLPSFTIWSAGAYLLNDIVSHDGDLWKANAVTSEEPSDLAIDWDLDIRITCIIGASVIIGSTSTVISGVSNPSFVAGFWPTGLIPSITNNGKIYGAGGLGGKGRAEWNGGTNAAIAGERGGMAFYAQTPIKLANNGTIAGGGGGGGGGGAQSWYGSQCGGGGGGGGAGARYGSGGQNGINRLVGSFDGRDSTDTLGGAGGIKYVEYAGSAGDGRQGGNLGGAGSTGLGINPSAGGAGGIAIDGISNIDLLVSGTILGLQIN